jgi:hypothetical protein
MGGHLLNPNEADTDSEINEMHGLAHLHASDEELYSLLSNISHDSNNE